jgi:hypothetical protein
MTSFTKGFRRILMTTAIGTSVLAGSAVAGLTPSASASSFASGVYVYAVCADGSRPNGLWFHSDSGQTGWAHDFGWNGYVDKFGMGIYSIGVVNFNLGCDGWARTYYGAGDVFRSPIQQFVMNCMARTYPSCSVSNY